MTMSRKLFAVLCLMTGMVSKGTALDQMPTVSGVVLTIPVVAVGDDQYRVELTAIAGTDPLELALTDIEVVSVENPSHVSTFEGIVLHIPSITLGEVSYFADLELVGLLAPFTFRLIDIGVVPDPVLPPSQNRAPVARFSFQQGETPFEIIFDPSESFDPDGEIVRYMWDFGDFGGSSRRFTETVSRIRFDDEPVSFTYEYLNWESTLDFSQGMEEQVIADNPPVVTVRLQVMDDDGAMHTFTHSVEIASIVEYPGQQALIDRIEQSGGWSGRIYINENPGSHADRVFRKLLQEGVPREHIERSVDNRSRPTDPELFVRNFSILAPISFPEQVDYINSVNEVQVAAAGNVDSRNVTRCVDDDYPTPRDLWDRNHPFWTCEEAFSEISPEWFDVMVAAVETGKVLIAVSAIRQEDGSVIPNERSVTCGDLAEHCFTVTHSHDGTSFAAPRVAAVLFHLRQMYETAEEAVAAARQCVQDIGEPGPDREFGLGLLDLRCSEAMLPIIQR